MDRRLRDEEWREIRDRERARYPRSREWGTRQWSPEREWAPGLAGPGGYDPMTEHSDYGFQAGSGAYGDYGGADRFSRDFRDRNSPFITGESGRRGPPALIYSETWMIAGPYAGRGPAGYHRPDELIREDVCETLSRNGDLDASDIEVKVQDGVVELHGNVDQRQDKYLAEDLAENVSGVSEVLSRLRVRKSSRAESWERKFREERERGEGGYPADRSDDL